MKKLVGMIFAALVMCAVFSCDGNKIANSEEVISEEDTVLIIDGISIDTNSIPVDVAE